MWTKLNGMTRKSASHLLDITVELVDRKYQGRCLKFLKRHDRRKGIKCQHWIDESLISVASVSPHHVATVGRCSLSDHKGLLVRSKIDISPWTSSGVPTPDLVGRVPDGDPEATASARSAMLSRQIRRFVGTELVGKTPAADFVDRMFLNVDRINVCFCAMCGRLPPLPRRFGPPSLQGGLLRSSSRC